MQLYPHQQDAVTKALPVLIQHKLVYLIMEVRTGKTITSLTIAREYFDGTDHQPVIGFITKKKAIPSIVHDYRVGKFDNSMTLVCINYERIAELPQCDMYIIDEAHSCGQYPKPSKRTQDLKKHINKVPCILLSGTPTPESFSQIFHQLWITGNSPFAHTRFYDWAKDGYVTIKQKMIGGFRINDYSKANDELINNQCGHLFVSCSQADAGFTCDVQESFVTIQCNDIAKYLFKTLERDQVCEWGGHTFIADTPANMLNKMSQIAGGSLIPDGSDEGIVFDDTKAAYIRDHYAGKRVAVYYRYKAELKILQSFFHQHTLDWTSFEAGEHCVFFSQIQSGREGISLRSADAIIMYNIDFSATSYWQVRARMQYKDRKEPANVVWLFSDLGIESKVYQAVSKKKNFTVSYYNKHVRKTSTSQNSQKTQRRGMDGRQNNELFPSWMAGSASHEKREDHLHRGEGAGRDADAAAVNPSLAAERGWF